MQTRPLASANDASPPSSPSILQMTDPVDYFDHYFEVVPATTVELQRIAFRLRFDVYTQQLHLPGFESERFPNHMEQDSYDERSPQCLLRHRTTGSWAGLVRLVLPKPGNPERPFPTEEQVGSALDTTYLTGIDRRAIGEISRLIVSPEFRKRRDDAKTAYGGSLSQTPSDKDRRRALPLPLLGLLAAVKQMSTENDILYWLAVMEPHLNRLLRTLGVDLQPIGPAVLLSGSKRFPCFGKVSDVLNRARHINPAAWSIITNHGAR